VVFDTDSASRTFSLLMIVGFICALSSSNRQVEASARLGFAARRDIAAFTLFFGDCGLFALLVQLKLRLLLVISVAFPSVSHGVNALERGCRAINAGSVHVKLPLLL
jgi:hypothetical protein